MYFRIFGDTEKEEKNSKHETVRKKRSSMCHTKPLTSAFLEASNSYICTGKGYWYMDKYIKINHE